MWGGATGEDFLGRGKSQARERGRDVGWGRTGHRLLLVFFVFWAQGSGPA